MGAAELVVPPVTAEVMEGRDSERIISQFVGRREEINGFYIPETNLGNKMAYTELSRSSSQPSSSHCQDSLKELKLENSNNSPLSISHNGGKQVRRRGKTTSSNSGYSKRPRMGQMEDLSMNEFEANDVKEKSQMAKAKNGLNGKRVDRRNGKISMKSKYDLFSLKSGMVTFNSGGGGNNSLGICGIKPDAYDITKHLDEVTVKELLDGHCKGPSLAKDKGKRVGNINETILDPVRKACSILQRKKGSKVQNSAEIDNTYNWNVSAAPVCVDPSKNDDEKVETSITNLSSHGKVPPKVLDFLLCRPKDILERVGLPPSVDLDALLLEAAKPVIFSKDGFDSRGKQTSQRSILANSDSFKLSSNRSTCHGKWVKIDNTAALFEGRNDFFAELESLKYDPNLVPVRSMKYLPSANFSAASGSVSFPVSNFCSSSSATCSRASQLSPEYNGDRKCEGEAEDSPRSLTAAQTLCDILKQFPKQEKHQRMVWTSKNSDKTIKACRSKQDNKFVEISGKSEFLVPSIGPAKNKETSSIFKKPRLLINEKVKDINTGIKGVVNWSIPRSSIQSSSRSYRDNHTNVKSYNSIMMPPPSSRVFDKACNNRQKLR